MWRPHKQLDISLHRKRAREISLRERAIGGQVRKRAWFFPRKLLQRGRSILIIIHGFNVTLCEAGCAYEEFEQNLSLYWRARAVSLYWPGDMRNWFNRSHVARGKISEGWAAVNYPRQIGCAKSCSSMLADGFREAILARASTQRPLELVIVAHSLGCRVALEFLRLLDGFKRQKFVSIPLTVLMAAAVPQYMVRRGARLAQAITVPDKVLIYKSKQDKVLSTAFRPGQMLEWSLPHGLTAKARTAIGRGGCGQNVIGRAACGENVTDKIQEISRWRGHSDYWPDQSIASEIIETLNGEGPAPTVSRSLELRERVRARPIIFRVSDGRRLSSRPVGRRGLRRVCKSC